MLWILLWIAEELQTFNLPSCIDSQATQSKDPICKNLVLTTKPNFTSNLPFLLRLPIAPWINYLRKLNEK